MAEAGDILAKTSTEYYSWLTMSLMPSPLGTEAMSLGFAKAPAATKSTCKPFISLFKHLVLASKDLRYLLPRDGQTVRGPRKNWTAQSNFATFCGGRKTKFRWRKNMLERK
jgi:hypothetical protein